MIKPSTCIVLAIGGHWDSGTSVTTQFKALADELVIRGHQVVILIPGRMISRVVEKGNPLVFTWPSQRPTKLRDAWFLYRIIKQYKPVCLIANFASVNWMMLIGWLMKVKERIAWYHTLSGAQKLDDKENVLAHTFEWLRKIFIYRLATHIVPVSYAAQRDICSLYQVSEEKCKVFHNLLKDPVSSGVSIPFQREKNMLTCVGRMDYSKGQDVLIKAIPAIIKRFPDIELRLIGDGLEKSRLKLLVKELGIENHVIFVGKIKQSAVIHELAQSYINIHPTRMDNCPLVLIEAMAVGTPIVASEVGGIPEIIRHAVDGVLVQPENSEIMAERICCILESRELWDIYSKNARKHFLDEFEFSSKIPLMANWLESLC